MASVSSSRRPSVVLCGLYRPQNFSGIQIHSHDTIGGLGRGAGVGIACADVKRTAFGIDGGSVPYASAGRSPSVGPVCILPTIFGTSAIVYVFQICLPVAASSATTFPRKEQHGYFGSELVPSSDDATGTYTRSSKTWGAPVIRAAVCSSVLTFQISVPFWASSAYTFAFRSPKYAIGAGLPGLMESAVRTPAWPETSSRGIRVGVQCINHSGVGADEHSSDCHHRLSEHLFGARQSKSPLQFETGNLARGHLRRFCRLDNASWKCPRPNRSTPRRSPQTRDCSDTAERLQGPNLPGMPIRQPPIAKYAF